jgi:hypothetical protein
VKEKVIPVTIGTNGTISKSFRLYLSNIPGKREIMELQNTAALGTAHILRKLLIYLTWEITLHVAKHCKYRTAATLYTLDTVYVSGI